MAQVSGLAPQQYKQSSRKGKQAWRKNVDITDVQGGLEEVRDQIIQGGVIAEKSADQLFLTDTAGAANIKNEYLKRHKPLKADEILAKRSAVPAVSNHKRPADSMVTDGIILPKARKPRLSYKEYERLRKIAYGGDTTHKDVVRSGNDASYDPWAVSQGMQDPKFSFLEENNLVREPRTLKRAPESQLKSGKSLPGVKTPSSGKSYNPAFNDWYDLLQREGANEVEAEKQRLEQERLEKERQALIEKAQAEELEREALSEWETEWESEWEGIQSEPEAEWLQKKRPTRKTQAEKNRIKRRKEEERRKLQEQRVKAKEKQAAQVQALAQAVEEKERLRNLRLQQAKQDNEADSSDDLLSEEELARRKGRAPIPDAPLEVLLPDELTDSLRLLKPEGNLLLDRFRNMLLRGRVEARRRVAARKKRRVELTEKWSYKDWKLT